MSGRQYGPLAGIPPERAGELHPVWDVIAPRDGLGGFLPSEFRHPYQMDVHALLLFHRIRLDSGVPMRINSSYRTPAENAAVGGARNSAHVESPCTALDLQLLSNAERYRLLASALRHGVHRIGLAKYRADPSTGAGLLHLDLSRTLPPDVCW